MSSEDRSALEVELRRLCVAQEWSAATTAAIKGYGPEVFSFLVAMTHDETEASDAFAGWSENLWKGIRTFRGDGSFRGWAYAVARHLLSRRSRDPRRRWVLIGDAPEVLELAEHVRTTTLVHLRTEVKHELARLRESLDPADRTLLILRLDRHLPWTEIARIVADEELSETQLKTNAAALRKRFERAKERLGRLMRAPRAT